MADAEVGDEQQRRDPSVNRLCEEIAELLGKEAAVFLPSGTMCNQIAMAVHCEAGDEITFKVFDFSTNTLVDMESGIETTWENFGISVINLTEMRFIPSEISLGTPYPNPFNPVTNISFSIPADMDVEIVVYDMRGSQILSLTDRLYEAGYHDVFWNAGQVSSGIYFVKMIAGDYVSTQKLMLVK